MMALDFEDDVTPVTSVAASDGSKIGRVTDLARDLVRAKRAVDDAEAVLKAAKDHLNGIENRLLPEAMEEIGMSEFKLSNGYKVVVEPFVYCSIIAENSDKTRNYEPAANWLEEHGHEGLAKNEIILGVDRKMANAVPEIIQKFQTIATLMVGRKAKVTRRRSIHWQTLRSWAKELIENGEEPPRDLFDWSAGNRAKLIAPPEEMF